MFAAHRVRILLAVLLLMSCATASRNFIVSKDQFFQQAATIAVMPVEPAVMSDSAKPLSEFWPVVGAKSVFRKVELGNFVRNYTIQDLDSAKEAIQRELVQQLQTKGFKVITPWTCRQLLIDIYRQNGILTKYDTFALSNDPLKTQQIEEDWYQSLPCDIRIQSTILFTWAKLSNASPTYNAPAYGAWDGTREVYYQGPGMMVFGETSALSIGLAAVDKKNNLLWWGKGGLALIKEKSAFKELFEQQRIKKSVTISLNSLSK